MFTEKYSNAPAVLRLPAKDNIFIIVYFIEQKHTAGMGDQMYFV